MPNDNEKRYQITLLNNDGTAYEVIKHVGEEKWFLGSREGNQIAWEHPETGKAKRYSGRWIIEEE